MLAMDHRISKPYSSRRPRSRSVLPSSSGSGRTSRPRAATVTTLSPAYHQALWAAANNLVDTIVTTAPVASQPLEVTTANTIDPSSIFVESLFSDPISSLRGSLQLEPVAEESAQQLAEQEVSPQNMSTLLYGLPAQFDQYAPLTNDVFSNYTMDQYSSGQQSSSYTQSTTSSSGYTSYATSPALPGYSPVPSSAAFQHYTQTAQNAPHSPYSYTPASSIAATSPSAQTSPYLSPPTSYGTYGSLQGSAYSASSGYSAGYSYPAASTYPPATSSAYSYGQPATASRASEESVRVLNPRPKPQCWEHGCNGRQFSTFSNLLRHQREKSGAAQKSYCPRCGAEFTRTTAMKGHMAQDKCKKPTTSP